MNPSAENLATKTDGHQLRRNRAFGKPRIRRLLLDLGDLRRRPFSSG
ncbi:MAG TPA: hypothetical protein VH371_06950 [Candidatus Limnocylindrales bacterium]|jgi:hypothetical protein